MRHVVRHAACKVACNVACTLACIVACIVATLLAALATTSAACAHASLLRSDPADRAVLAQPPTELQLTFNEAVSPLVLRLVRPTGEINDVQAGTGSNGSVIVVPITGGLAQGTHLLSWRVMSADGHPVGGALTFSVAQPSAAPLSAVSAELPLLGAIWLARLLLYVGCLFGVGGACYLAWVAGAPPSTAMRRFCLAALMCGLAAAFISMGLQGVDALGQSLTSLANPAAWRAGLSSSYGLTLCVVTVALVVGSAALSRNRTRGRWFSACALLLLGTALACSGHAATAAPQYLTRPAVFIHAVCVTVWLGALVPLAAGLRMNRAEGELSRFSRLIPWPVLALVLSGAALIVVQVPTINALWTTSYGLILSAKVLALAFLFALAALNRRLTPRVIGGDKRAQERVGKSIRAELVLSLVILALVASWRFTPPPRSLLAAQAQPVRVHIHAERAMADLQIEASADGTRTFTFNVLDGKFEPLAAKEVSLVLAKPKAGLEPLRLPAVHVEEAVWRVRDVRLPQAGRWRLGVEILVNDFEKISIEDEVELPR
ncbi:MAG: copper resistance CopC/CopD family protein [Xanthobacteraceae bacterium]